MAAWVLFGLVAIGVVMTAMDLSEPALTRRAECRTAVVAREMLQSQDYILPTLNGVPRLEKPPLYYWAILPFAEALGRVDETAARLPAFCSALALLVVVAVFACWRARRERLPPDHARISGLLAALMLLAMPGFWLRAVSAEAESLLALVCGLILFFLYQDLKSPHPRWLLLAYLFSAIGFMVKGPVFFVFTWPVYLFLARQRLRRDLLWHGTGLLLFLLIALPWYLLVVLRLNGSLGAFTDEVAMRFKGGAPHQEPIYFYLLHLLAMTGPLVIGLPRALRLAWERGKRALPERYLLFSSGIALLILSLLQSKQAHYLLPLFPFIAVILSDAADPAQRAAEKTARINSVVRGVLLVCTLCLSVAFWLLGAASASFAFLLATVLAIVLFWPGKRLLPPLQASACALAALVLAGYWAYADIGKVLRNLKYDEAGYFAGMRQQGISGQVATAFVDACLFYRYGERFPQIEADPLDLSRLRQEHPETPFLITSRAQLPVSAQLLAVLNRSHYWLWDVRGRADTFGAAQFRMAGGRGGWQLPDSAAPSWQRDFSCGRLELFDGAGVALLQFHLRNDCSPRDFLDVIETANRPFAARLVRWKLIWLEAEPEYTLGEVNRWGIEALLRRFAEVQNAWVVLDATGLMRTSKLPNGGRVFQGPGGASPAPELLIKDDRLWLGGHEAGGDAGSVWRQRLEADQIVLAREAAGG